MADSSKKREKYTAALVLSGVGDALGYNGGSWEFNTDAVKIHQELAEKGGLSKLDASEFLLSDDSILQLATATALVADSSGESKNSLYLNLAKEYALCMKDMKRRAPGETIINALFRLTGMLEKDSKPRLFKVPFNIRGGGCGAAVRAMSIGLRYPGEENLSDLIEVSIESGRLTHHHPTGYLGALVSALFTSFIMQNKPIKSWGSKLVKEVLPKAKDYIVKAGVDVDNNTASWGYFSRQWSDYLEKRKISDGNSEAVFPDSYGVKERDQFYKIISYDDWGGASGHDVVIIAYDALLGCKGSWDELCNRGVFHGGDNDGTGAIAGFWFGAMYGFSGVHDINHKKIEYREKMEKLAKQLYKLANPKA